MLGEDKLEAIVALVIIYRCKHARRSKKANVPLGGDAPKLLPGKHWGRGVPGATPDNLIDKNIVPELPAIAPLRFPVARSWSGVCPRMHPGFGKAFVVTRVRLPAKRGQPPQSWAKKHRNRLESVRHSCNHCHGVPATGSMLVVMCKSSGGGRGKHRAGRLPVAASFH